MSDNSFTHIPLIHIENFSLKENYNVLFKDFNLDIFYNEIIGLSAPTGSGKTTLLNLIAGLSLSSDFEKSGVISVHDDMSVSYVFQEPRLLENQSVLKNVMLPLLNVYDKQTAKKKAEYFIQKFDLGTKINQLCKNLSGGEKQRVSIARAFAYPSRLLLLDEPFHSQDENKKQKFITETVNLIKIEQRTCIIVSHDKEELKAMNARIITDREFK
jgi:ABC-type nitrate/sulfonate/bicarbonate transport system ATPase subunit